MAVEGAIAISILVAAFTGLMAMVQEVYTTDRLERAARAAARAIALNAGADPCAAIRREFGLAEEFDCSERWQITVHEGLSPSDLSAAPRDGSAASAASGEMVMVRIAWSRGSEATDDPSDDETDTDPETLNGADISGQGDDPPEPEEPDLDAGPVPMVAMGVARREPDAG